MKAKQGQVIRTKSKTRTDKTERLHSLSLLHIQNNESFQQGEDYVICCTIACFVYMYNSVNNQFNSVNVNPETLVTLCAQDTGRRHTYQIN